MEGPARQSLLAKCGRDPRCALYAAPGERSEQPPILLEKMACRETRRARLRYRRCGFALKSPARAQRLTCSVEFHEVPGDAAFPWSDRRLVKPRREYLPTSGLMAPLILGNSTLACSGSLADYAG